MKNNVYYYLVMLGKYSIYSYILGVILFSAAFAKDGNAQGILSVKEARITLELSDQSIIEAFSTIEAQTDYFFVYDPMQLVESKKISLKVRNAPVERVLLDISKQAKIGFRQVNNRISVKVNEDVNYKEVEIIMDQQTVTGKISDENGDGLPGATVLEKGTNNGTITDADGLYSLPVNANATLTISFVGYQLADVAVNGRSVVDFKLVQDISALEEVVVVGYGTQQKVNLTGAVGVADGKVLQNRPIANVGEGLQGVVPNLNVNIRNGDPSQPIEFNIRGYQSINGGQPLILVDNVPMDLNKINPNDIESISVLKDASAAAIYGARGAFGVVLVTTKKGQGERINVSFGGEFTMSKPILFIDPITDPYEFVTARNIANLRTNGSLAYDQDYIDGTKAWSENPTEANAWKVFDGDLRFYGYNNYQERLITDFAPQQKYNASISGSSDKASYYVSFGMLNKDGYLLNKEKNENFKRYNILMKGEFKANEWLSFDSRALITTEKSDKPHFYNWDVNINTTARVNPLNPVTFPDLPYYLTPGDHAVFEPYIGKHFGSTNFLPYLEQGGRQTWDRNDIVLTQGVTVTPLKGWDIKANYSSNIRFRNYQDVASKVEVLDNFNLEDGIVTSNGLSGNDFIQNETNYDVIQVINMYTDYTIETNGHYVKAMVGFNQEWGNFQYIRGQAASLLNPDVADLNTTTGSQTALGGKEGYSLRGAFFRLNYIFKERYLIEANGRYDGTSRFPTNDRFGFFPSFSVGWRISNEAFMSGTSAWLDNLKLRASYGQLGNQLLFTEDVPPQPIYYPAIATLASGASGYMMSGGSRIPFLSPPGLVSPTLTWETVVSKNIGLDFTILGSRLDVSLDAYTRDTKDMLTRSKFPDILGAEAPQENAADLRTQGWEVAATWRTRVGSDFSYDVTLALSDNKAEITKYDNPTGSLDEYYVGQVLGERWGYVTQGIFQTDDEIANAATQNKVQDGSRGWRPGDIRYADLNGDGEITKGDNTLENPGDQQIIAYESPRYSYGIGGNVRYKSFSLNLFFQGVLKYDYWPPNDNWVAFYPYNAGHVEKYYLTDTWSEDNRDAYFPAPHISTNTKQNVQAQSRYVQNGAYLRLKNVTLSYNLPQDIAGKIGLSDVQVYFSGMNVFEFTGMRKPLDPEVRPTLTQEYYKQRSYALGFRVSF